ncbi:hypothetical protein [Vibrio campbellii]|uniref:hypothetical protein n=1 Tax=Vibrio campbellii TaxID=680 RepID=UPI00249B2277|nr:hypothetical protein [Vibrio campbellii]
MATSYANMSDEAFQEEVFKNAGKPKMKYEVGSVENIRKVIKDLSGSHLGVAKTEINRTLPQGVSYDSLDSLSKDLEGMPVELRERIERIVMNQKSKSQR